MKKPKISLEVTPEQHAALVTECEARKISLSDLVRDKLFGEKPTEAAPALAPVAAAQIEHPRHPCFYLSTAIPFNYSARDCKGTCTSPAQNGRPCFWGAAHATSCDKFQPIVLRRR